MGMELLIAIIAVAVIAILWAIRNDMKVDSSNEEKAAREEFAKEVRDWANEATEKMTVTVTETETTEVFVEEAAPVAAPKKKVAKPRKPKADSAPKAKPAAPKAAPKKKVAPKKKKAAPAKKV